MNTYITRYRFQMTAFLAVLALASCEKIIDISIPDKEQKMVVNGLINSDQPIIINLSRSMSVLEKDSLVTIIGGDVNLFQGSNLIGKFQELTMGFYTLPDFKPQVGQTYRLTASYDGLKPIEATAILPPLVPIISADTATLTGEWGQQELRLTIKFKDPADVHNIYGFGVNATYKEFDYFTMTFTGKKLSHYVFIFGNTDKFLKDESHNFEGKLYFEDLLFDGLMKTVEFGISDYSFFESDTVWLDVRMEQIDPSYYLYVLSNEAYQQAHGNPFSEPVQVYTNVKDGYGIFAGSSAASFSIITLGMRKFE